MERFGAKAWKSGTGTELERNEFQSKFSWNGTERAPKFGEKNGTERVPKKSERSAPLHFSTGW